MPLLLAKEIDRSVYALNTDVYGIYFDDVSGKTADSHTRWARGQHVMLPIVAYETPGKFLTPETAGRDNAALGKDTAAVFEKLRAGSVVIMYVDEYDAVVTGLKKVNPAYSERLTSTLGRFMEF